MAEPSPLVPARPWEPASRGAWRSYVGRVLSVPCYPFVLPYAFCSFCDATPENARFFRNWFVGLFCISTPLLHALVYRRWRETPTARGHLLAHLALLFSWDHSHAWFVFIAQNLMEILAVDRMVNRLNAGKLHGPRVLVVGNGPSAVAGDQRGDEIDKFDEVVRFNNFQTKVAGLEKWVGTKTTVHFSDGVLYPTYKEYYVPGATIILSLLADRFIVAGSYVIMRLGADLQVGLTLKFLKDPQITWIEKKNIDRLKELLGLRGIKHPTSGMLAIDYFVNKPGVQLPVYIHGFDFFQGPKIHYYAEHEPLYERINNHIGVNAHSPHLEKIYVEKLIAQGKVKFLKDMPKAA